jgi:adenosylcobinamide-phosphate synthase
MSFFAVLLALLIEQARPLRPDNFFHLRIKQFARFVLRNVPTHQSSGAALAWYFLVIMPAVLSVLVHWFLYIGTGFVAVLIFHVAILFLCLGFRQFSFHFTVIRDALDAGEHDEADKLLRAWQQQARLPDIGVPDATHLAAHQALNAREKSVRQSNLIQRLLAQSILAAYTHVFAVLIWYALLAAIGFGPAGAIIFRLADFLYRNSQVGVDETQADEQLSLSSEARQFFKRAAEWINWLPVRLCALGFAITGSFEDAMNAWRDLAAQAKAHPDQHGPDANTLLLATSSGALNVNFQTSTTLGSVFQSPELSHIPKAVGLIWRSVVFWVLLIALLTLANFLG